MTNASRLFASFLFAGIGLFLIGYTWLPARSSLHLDDGSVTSIVPQRNTWYEVVITTVGGAKVTCRTRRGWPIAGPDLCPLERFERHLGQAVTVLHDGTHLYEVVGGDRVLVAWSAQRTAQALGIAFAVGMLGMAAWVWRRSS